MGFTYDIVKYYLFSFLCIIVIYDYNKYNENDCISVIINQFKF